MNVRIRPRKLEGTVAVPPSKSLTHRAIICASLAEGKSIIKNVNYSKDILATIEAMSSLGASIEKFDDYLIINGCFPHLVNNVIDSFESGSTLRFLIPLSIVNKESVTFVGHNRLIDRPLDIYLDIFDKLNIEYKKPDDHYLPLNINGALKSGEYRLKGNVSSQFITGLLFSLPLLKGDSKIIITTNLESKSYIDLTLDILKKFNINIKYEDNIFYIKGSQKYKPRDYTVEGDFSQAAFWLGADMLGSNIKVSGMNENSIQGDLDIINDFKKMGASIEYNNGVYTCVSNKLKNVDIDVSQTPDLGPILACVFTKIKGTSRLVNAKRLKIKESDRIVDVAHELNKLNAKVSYTDDSLIVEGISDILGNTVDSHNDHRLAMAFSILATVSKKDVVILNASSVSKSYPDFFEIYKALKGDISYE